MQTSSLTTTAILANIVISTLNTKFTTVDIRDFYHGTPFQGYKYVRVVVDTILDEDVKQYQLFKLVNNGWICLEI